MKKRPLIIKIVALGYVLTPLTFVIQYLYFSNLSITDAESFKHLITPYKLSFIIIPPIIAYGIFRVHEWGWYLALAHLIYITGNNTVALFVGSRTPHWAIYVFTVITFVVLLTFVRKEIRAPYFNPRVRWWETKPRYKITLDVEMSNDRTEITGETYNISEGGMFMVSEDDVNINEHFNVKLSRKEVNPVSCEGNIVWINKDNPNIPSGFGFKFSRLDKEGLLVIKSYIKEQKKLLKEEAQIR